MVTLDRAGGADFVCDISDADRVDAVFDEIGAGGALDGLLNNAGLIVTRKNHDEIPLDEWDLVFAVNVKGTFLCSRAAVRHMPNGGSIVNVASATALSGSQGFVHYEQYVGLLEASVLLDCGQGNRPQRFLAWHPRGNRAAERRLRRSRPHFATTGLAIASHLAPGSAPDSPP